MPTAPGLNELSSRDRCSPTISGSLRAGEQTRVGRGVRFAHATCPPPGYGTATSMDELIVNATSWKQVAQFAHGRLVRLFLATLLLGLLASQSARASYVTYSFDAELKSLCEWSGGPPECSDARGGLSIGSIYRGYFSLDGSLLATDGQKFLSGAAGVQSLDFELGLTAWTLVGSEGCVRGVLGDPSVTGCTATSVNYWSTHHSSMGWDLQVQGGELVGISGGALAWAGSWFGFSTNADGSSSFSSASRNYVEGGNTQTSGTVTVNRVSEPATLALVFFALTGMRLASGKRRWRNAKPA